MDSRDRRNVLQHLPHPQLSNYGGKHCSAHVAELVAFEHRDEIRYCVFCVASRCFGCRTTTLRSGGTPLHGQELAVQTRRMAEPPWHFSSKQSVRGTVRELIL